MTRKLFNSFSIFLMLFLGGLLIPASGFAGTSHTVYGSVTDPGTLPETPADGDITFTAYVQGRESEVITESSPSAGYGEGSIYLNSGNFTTPWSAGETLIVEITRTSNFHLATVQVTLTNAGTDTLPQASLEMPTLLSIDITPVDPAVTVPNTEQFTAMGTFEGVTNPIDISSSVTWVSTDQDKGTIDVNGLFSSNHVGTTEITATSSTVTSNTSIVTVNTGAIDTDKSTVETDAANVTTDGGATANITVTLLDANDNPIQGETVTLEADGTIHTITQPAVTDENGQATGTIASTKTGTQTITAKVGTTVVGTVNVTFDPGAIDTTKSTVETDAPNVTTDGGAVATITVTLLDANSNPIPGQTVTLESTGTSDTITQPAVTDENGQATGTIASTKAETITITAMVGTTVIGTVDVTFDPGAVAATNSTVLSDVPNVTTDSGAVATITVTLRDANNNLIPGQTVTLESDGSNNTITQPAAVTDANGQTTGTIASTKAETKTITAKVGETVVGTVNVTFDPGVAVSFKVTSLKDKLASNGKGTTTVSATIYDANGNIVTSDNGRTVNFAVTAGDTYLKVNTAASTTTDGVAETTVTTQGGDVPTSPTTTTVTATSAGLTGTPDSVNIDVVNFSATPDATILVTGQTINIVAVGADNYTWTVSAGNGTITGTGASVTYTAPATITEGNAGHASTVTVKDTDNPTVTFDLNFTTFNPVQITAPATAIGLAHDGDTADETTYQLQVTGGDGTYTYQVSDGSADVITVSNSGLITAVAVGTKTVYVWDSHGSAGTDDGFRATTPDIVVVNDIAITPANADLESTGTQQYAATGGSGSYTWDATNANAGSIDTAGLYTAATVTAHEAATITATDATYTNISDTATADVYATVTITNKPTPENSTIKPGENSDTFTVAGGDDTLYTWTVDGPVAVEGGTGANYTFTAPTTGDFAGEYTITVTDNKGFTDSFTVKVPMKIDPKANVITTADTMVMTVTGSTGNLTWEILDREDAAAEVATPEDYGTWGDTTANSNTFTPADVAATKVFYVRVTSEDAALAALDLDVLVGGPYRIVKVATYTVTVTDSNDETIEGINVTVDGKAATTDENGVATFELPDTGGTYQYMVEDAINNAYIPQEVFSSRTDVDVTLEEAGDAFTGTVTNKADGTTGLADVDVAALYYDDVTGVMVAAETVTASDGTYTLYVPASDPADREYDILASVDGYQNTIVKTKTPSEAPGTTVDIEMWPATSINIVATEGDNSVTMKITADPAFDNSDDTAPANAGTQLQVSLIDPNNLATGTLGAMTFDATDNSYSITYSALEDFIVQILADTSADRDVTTDNTAEYVLETVYTHLVGSTTGTSATGTAGTATGGTQGINANGQNAMVEVPAGGVAKDAAIAIRQTEKSNKESTSTNGSPDDYIYEIVASDLTTGEELTGADINRIEITLPIDLTVIGPADLEKGVFTIYHAVSQAALEAGGGTAVPVSQIISTDYMGDGVTGSVTFWVNSLSYFVGSAAVSSGPVLIDSSDDSRCFIATAAFGSPFETHVATLRHFRDRFLMPTSLGRAFVHAYYRLSPPMADFIAGHDSLRAGVRVALMPLVGMSWMLLHFGLLPTIILFGVLFSLGLLLTFRLVFFSSREA
jgi:hypothetical protein